jgi:hypothetical protein
MWRSALLSHTPQLMSKAINSFLSIREICRLLKNPHPLEVSKENKVMFIQKHPLQRTRTFSK